MDEKRKGEIALIFLKYKLSRDGIRLTLDIKNELDNVAKKTGISQDELKKFGRAFVEEFSDEVFGKKN